MDGEQTDRRWQTFVQAEDSAGVRVSYETARHPRVACAHEPPHAAMAHESAGSNDARPRFSFAAPRRSSPRTNPQRSSSERQAR